MKPGYEPSWPDKCPIRGSVFFALDGSPWPRPRARTLEDRQYVYQASSDVNGGTIAIGYPYSSLDWVQEPHSSWAQPVDERRASSSQTPQEVGTAQIQDLAQARADVQEALDLVACDGKYGNAGFLRSVKGIRCGIVARLRYDRVLFGPPPPRTPHKRGRNKLHGKRFAFKEPDTWGEPDERVELVDPYWGQVRLERWHNLHEKKGVDVPYEVIRASVHQEREKPPAALWLAWLAPKVIPTGLTVSAETIWRGYESRWPIEPGLHFRKATLGWTMPRFQSAETGDRWTWLTALATWMIFLARPIVEDTPLPWQKPQLRLTPQRVQQSIRPIFALMVPLPSHQNNAEFRPAGPKVGAERPNPASRWSKRRRLRLNRLETRLVRYCFSLSRKSGYCRLSNLETNISAIYSRAIIVPD